MKTKIFLVKSIAFMLIVLMISVNSTCIAASASSLKNERDEINDKIDELQDEKDEVTSSKSKALKEIDKLTNQMNTYQNEIDDLEDKVDKLNDDIDKLQKKIDEATAEYNKQSDLLDARLVTYYMAGQTSYLDLILSSRDFSELVSNYHMMEVLTENDNELLAKIEKQRKEIEADKEELDKNKKEVEDSKKKVEEKNNKLKKSKDEKKNLVSKLSKEEKEIQKQLDEFEEDKRKIQAQLAAISNQYTTVTEPSACGYIFPVAGLTRANINVKKYPSYKGHTGVDVNINVVGKKIVAVKSGTVITSKALKRANGKYRSYGEYIVIDHHDGTMTLYAHGLAGSRKVRAGQKVSQGQVIMTVGSTGNSTGPHLHFEVRVKGRPVNPFPYLP